jgi:uncharacterized damage-inducible protein DinB
MEVPMVEELRELYDFNRWANRLLLASAKELTPEQFGRDLGSSFPSVQATLAHILGAESVWLDRWRGLSPSGIPAEFRSPDIESLQARWGVNDAEQVRFLDGLSDAKLRTPIRFRSFAGVDYETPLWVLMRHVVNHGTYHRGQVATLLRQLGATPPSTDLVLYYRTQAVPMPLPPT